MYPCEPFENWLTLFDQLNHRTLYTFGCLANLGVETLHLSGDYSVLFQKRMRLYLVRLAAVEEFPRHGDGSLFLHQTMVSPGWWGARWHDAVRARESLPIQTAATAGLFNAEEQSVDLIRPHWNRRDVLNQTGMFYLNDLAMPLAIDPDHIKTIALNRSDPWAYMGVRRVMGEWFVKMSVFSRWLSGRRGGRQS